MTEKASLTALMSAFARIWRAEHAEKPVFDDRMARALLTDGEYAAMQAHIAGGADFFLPGRTMDSTEAAVTEIVNEQLAPTPLSRFCHSRAGQAVKAGAVRRTIPLCRASGRQLFEAGEGDGRAGTSGFSGAEGLAI